MFDDSVFASFSICLSSYLACGCIIADEFVRINIVNESGQSETNLMALKSKIVRSFAFVLSFYTLQCHLCNAISFFGGRAKHHTFALEKMNLRNNFALKPVDFI